MQVTHKILIDRLVGQPIAWGLNFAARVLGKLLKRNHSNDPKYVHTIVFAKYLGMGSIIQATPLIRAVHMRYPDAEIIFLTGRSCVKLVERLEFINKVLVIDDSSLLRVGLTSYAATRTMMKARVDLFFDLEIYSFYASIMALVSMARNRIGFFRESAEHKRGNYSHLMYYNTHFPVRYVYLQLARLIQCEPVDQDRLGTLITYEQDEKHLLDKLGIAEIGTAPYFLVTPNTSGFGIERRWPPERFAAIIAQTAILYNTVIILPGIQEEFELNEAIISQIPAPQKSKVLNLAGKLTIGEFLALLKQAKCLITNDTGPMHMAWALGVPTVSLYGMCSPDKYSWDSPINVSLYHRVYCSPCVHEIDVPPCHGNNVCMQRISVDEVMEAIQTLLKRTNNVIPPHFNSSFFLDEQKEALGKVVPHKDYPEPLQ